MGKLRKIQNAVTSNSFGPILFSPNAERSYAAAELTDSTIEYVVFAVLALGISRPGYRRLALKRDLVVTASDETASVSQCSPNIS